jgi:hypothetical protein
VHFAVPRLDPNTERKLCRLRTLPLPLIGLQDVSFANHHEARRRANSLTLSLTPHADTGSGTLSHTRSHSLTLSMTDTENETYEWPFSKSFFSLSLADVSLQHDETIFVSWPFADSDGNSTSVWYPATVHVTGTCDVNCRVMHDKVHVTLHVTCMYSSLIYTPGPDFPSSEYVVEFLSDSFLMHPHSAATMEQRCLTAFPAHVFVIAHASAKLHSALLLPRTPTSYRPLPLAFAHVCISLAEWFCRGSKSC